MIFRKKGGPRHQLNAMLRNRWAKQHNIAVWFTLRKSNSKHSSVHSGLKLCLCHLITTWCSLENTKGNNRRLPKKVMPINDRLLSEPSACEVTKIFARGEKVGIYFKWANNSELKSVISNHHRLFAAYNYLHAVEVLRNAGHAFFAGVNHLSRGAIIYFLPLYIYKALPATMASVLPVALVHTSCFLPT